jgi:hypothetical protein
MTAPIRIGVNIHNKARSGQDRSAAEKDYLPGFLKQLNPSAIVVMDDLPLAEYLHALLQNTIVIYRQYNQAEGHMFKAVPSPADYVQRQRGLLKPGMPLYIMNEWDSKAPVAQLADGAKWMAGVMDILAVSGDLCVIDNEGPGQPDYSWFTDNTKWEAVKPLFDAFKRHPQMYWGLHPYWSRLGLRPEDGQSARHRDIERLLKVRGYEMPLVIFTEVGRDNYGGGKTNGWRSTGISEEGYAAEMIQARNTLWTEPYIRGACVYCYGSSTDDWAAFDIEGAKILHSALIGANKIETPPPAPPVPPPFNLQVLKVLYNDVLKASTRTRQLSLELATISDDLLKTAELLNAMIKANESTIK